MMMKMEVVAILAMRAAVGGRVINARASLMAKRRAAALKKRGRGLWGRQKGFSVSSADMDVFRFFNP
jgi:hypothetical protein